MRKLLVSASVILLGFFAFAATASAAGAVVPEDGSLLDLAKPVYEAVMGGQWYLGAALTLVLLVAAFRKYAPGKTGEWARGDIGTPILLLVGSFGGAMATGIIGVGTNSISVAMAWTAFKIALSAAGGYTLAKKLLAPIVLKIGSKAPAWMQPAFTLVFWFFESNPAITKAEVAGTVAVGAKPAPGAAVPGEISDI